MNLIELDRALKQLRLGGMAAVLETRLRQAQTEPLAPLTCSRAWSPTNSPGVANVCWSGAQNKRSSATRRRPSTASTSLSTRR